MQHCPQSKAHFKPLFKVCMAPSPSSWNDQKALLMSQENTEPVQDTPLYLLKGATINRPDGPLLKDMEWHIRDHAVTVLFGPGGTGKSMLLRILSGNAPPTHWSLQGSWRYREHDLSGGISSNHPPAEIAWFPQRKRPSPHQRLYPSSSKKPSRRRFHGERSWIPVL